MSINQRISELLSAKKGITQKKLAEYIGVATSTVNNWLKLGRSIPSEYIVPISEFFECTYEYLLTGAERKLSDIPDDDREWLSLLHQLPPDAQIEFRGEIKGYLKRLKEESVAADEIRQAK